MARLNCSFSKYTLQTYLVLLTTCTLSECPVDVLDLVICQLKQLSIGTSITTSNTDWSLVQQADTLHSVLEQHHCVELVDEGSLGDVLVHVSSGSDDNLSEKQLY